MPKKKLRAWRQESNDQWARNSFCFTLIRKKSHRNKKTIRCAVRSFNLAKFKNVYKSVTHTWHVHNHWYYHNYHVTSTTNVDHHQNQFGETITTQQSDERLWHWQNNFGQNDPIVVSTGAVLN